MKRNILLALLLLGLNILASAQTYSYLGTFTSNGVPNYLDTRDTVPQSLLSRVSSSLPEGYPVPIYNPQYITTSAQTDITLNDSADVWVTFVGEGAGYKNILGFYTYNKNNPPTSIPADSNITIVFPNVSANGSGGGLYVGDRVKIGRFPPNTGIGWVLLANGYQNNTVTSGLWRVFSNPGFNPENDTTLRHHNVLLRDTSTNSIVMGFEDIRRDYSSCDNDFNDALFYVKSNPITAIDTANINITTPAGQGVSSSNNGGLESHSGLSKWIGVRNVKRLKVNHNIADLHIKANDLKTMKATLKHRSAAKGTATVNLLEYVPDQLIASTKSYISSPEDLIEITTATSVWSVDYVNESNETVAAFLGTSTEGQVYDHTKVICDRLKGAELRTVTTKNINGYDFIQSCIVRPSGKVEYAISFSLIPQNGGGYHLESLWNLADYSKADEVLNVQVWSMAPAYTQELISELLGSMSVTKSITQVRKPELPALYVSKAKYNNGVIKMVVHNNDRVKQLNCTGTATLSETSGELPIQEQVDVTGAKEEYIEMKTGHLFDAGFRIDANGEQTDFIYQADGQWGLDYVKNNVLIKNYEIQQHNVAATNNAYVIERAVKLSVETDDYISIYRFFKAAASTMDISEYKSVDIKYTGNDMKLTLIIDGVDWKEYPSVLVTAGDEHISLTEFGDYDATKVKGVVFTPLVNDGSIDVAINWLALSTDVVAHRIANSNTLMVYPNPAKDVIYLNGIKSGDRYHVTDILGVMKLQGVYNVSGINVSSLTGGLYLLKREKSGDNIQCKFLIVK